MIKPPFPGELDAMARQYWNTWSEMLGRNGGAGSSGGWGLPAGMTGGMNNPFASNPFAGNPFASNSFASNPFANNPFAASLSAFGGPGGGMPPGLTGFDPGAYEWYQQMQRLAADFSSGGAHAAEVATAWREMMGGNEAKSFARMLRSMHGGLAGDTWLEQMRPMLESMLRPLRDKSAEWLHRPAFGPMREHQERLQALALAWQDWDRCNEDFNQLLARVGQDAFARFEVLLQECDQPGKRLESARALFDLWIEAAEEAWAEVAFTEEYRQVYGAMTNAMMRLRLGVQGEVERFAGMLGMPGRTEVDALARKVAELERAQYLARRAAKAAEAGNGAAAATARKPAPASVAARSAAAAPAAAPASVASPVTRPPVKVGKKKTSAKRAKAGKAARPVAARKAAPKRAATARKSSARPAVAPAVAAKAPPRRAPAKAAKRNTSQAPTTAARKASPPTAPAKVVSMKDWVSRNLPGIEPPVAPARGGKSGRK